MEGGLPTLADVREMLSLPPGTRVNMLPVSSGNVLVLPVQTAPSPLLEDQETRSYMTPTELVRNTPASESPAPLVAGGPLTHSQVHTLTAQELDYQAPRARPELLTRFESNGLGLGADESLADLQPEDDDEEEEHERVPLTAEQMKLEYMASLNLVPPVVLEEIHRRQQLCRVEYGNWWDRLHSTDFCLVPKNDSAFSGLQSLPEDLDTSPQPQPSSDETQVAAGPDTGSFVEQITYLTSWPQPSSTETAGTVEVVTQQHSSSANEPEVGAEVLKEHYLSLLERQADERALQATLQQLAGSFSLPSSS